MKRLLELLKIDRFREVKIETGLQARFALFGRCPTGQRDRFQGLLLFGFANEVEPVAVRQGEVADEDIKLHCVETAARFLKVFRRDRAATAPVQQESKNSSRVGVIFNQEDEHWFRGIAAERRAVVKFWAEWRQALAAGEDEVSLVDGQNKVGRNAD